MGEAATPPGEATTLASSRWGTASLRVALAVSCLAAVVVHVAFAQSRFSPLLRVLLAVPAALVFVEIYRYARRGTDGELPFCALGLVHYYGAFAWPSFFDYPFWDARGRVFLTDESTTKAVLAISIGAVCVELGSIVGAGVGRRILPWMLGIAPPAPAPSAHGYAVLIYAGFSLFVTLLLIVAPTFAPPSIAAIVASTTSLDYAFGLTFTVPRPSPRSPWRFAPHLALALLSLVGVMKGILEPLFRGVTAFLGARWAYARVLSFGILAAAALTYIVIQPVKGAFRANIWRANAEEQAGVGARVGAWSDVITSFWFTDRDVDSDAAEERAVLRIAEIDSVAHAFQMIPGRVPFLDGEGWVDVLISPIPRLFWRTKPASQDSVRNYGVVFERQTQRSARTTALNLPLLVDGYWNFGWPGIIFATFITGIWLGASQKVFASSHWTLRAIGTAWLYRLTIHSSLMCTYGSVFQNMFGLLLASWVVFGFGKLLTVGGGFSTSRHGTGIKAIPVRRRGQLVGGPNGPLRPQG